MAESILKIHTQNGDIPVGYPGLANKPIADKTLSVEGAFADSKVVGDRFKEVNAETDSLKEDIVPLEYDIYNQLNNINLDEWKTNNPNNTISEDNGVLSVIMNTYAEDFRIQRIGAIPNFQTGHTYYAKCE